MAKAIELAVIGAGPAGLAAAITAAEHNLSVTLIDIFSQPGGQYFKQPPPAWSDATSNRTRQYQQLMSEVNQPAARLLTDMLVWGIFPEDGGYLLGLYGPPGTPRRLKTAAVILAPGAYDRPYPFPGWTLPGVMTAGAALTLVKHQQVLPGRRILLSGTGPLQLLLAADLIAGGAEVVGVLEAAPFPWHAWRWMGAFWGQGERMREGWHAWNVLRRAGVKLRWGHKVFRAEGDGQVEQAVIGPVNGPGSQTVPVDTVVQGFGFVPATQLSLQAGCEHRYQADLGSFVPQRDEALQTTLPGLFVAGDGAKISGKDVALLEGRLAALGAIQYLQRGIDSNQMEQVKQKLVRPRQFARVLTELFPFPAWLDDAEYNTVLCRCEEVTLAGIRSAVAEGATTVNAVKMITRAGMGRCQGRMCRTTIAELIARESQQPAEAAGSGTIRPPIMPLPLDGLAAEELED